MTADLPWRAPGSTDLHAFYRYAVERYTDHFPAPAVRQLGQSEVPWDEADVADLVSRFQFQTEYLTRVSADAVSRGLIAVADAAYVYRTAEAAFLEDVAAERHRRHE